MRWMRCSEGAARFARASADVAARCRTARPSRSLLVVGPRRSLLDRGSTGGGGVATRRRCCVGRGDCGRGCDASSRSSAQGSADPSSRTQNSPQRRRNREGAGRGVGAICGSLGNHRSRLLGPLWPVWLSPWLSNGCRDTAQCPKTIDFIGRGGRIRTDDLLTPSQVRYRTAPRPDGRSDDASRPSAYRLARAWRDRGFPTLRADAAQDARRRLRRRANGVDDDDDQEDGAGDEPGPAAATAAPLAGGGPGLSAGAAR